MEAPQLLSGPEFHRVLIPDAFSFCLLFLHRIRSDDDRQVNWAHVNDKEFVKRFTYLLLQKSTFNHTVLYQQLKLNVQNLRSVHIKQVHKKEKKNNLTESACTGLNPHLSVPPPSPTSAPSCPIKSQLESRAAGFPTSRRWLGPADRLSSSTSCLLSFLFFMHAACVG